jgi:hypothetical protein
MSLSVCHCRKSSHDGIHGERRSRFYNPSTKPYQSLTASISTAQLSETSLARKYANGSCPHGIAPLWTLIGRASEFAGKAASKNGHEEPRSRLCNFPVRIPTTTRAGGGLLACLCCVAQCEWVEQGGDWE